MIFRGREVSRVRRVRYEISGNVRSEGGPLEITFVDDTVVVLRPAPDGERLAIETSKWIDTLAPPLSAENEEYVRTHGKWTAVDLSTRSPFSKLVGTEAELVSPVLNPHGSIVGFEAAFPLGVIRAEVVADELVVDVV